MLAVRFIFYSFQRQVVQNGIIHFLSLQFPHPVPCLYQRPKNLPIIPPATFLAIPLVFNALPAKFDACPNLSHLEKASVLVIVKLNAMTKTLSATLSAHSNTSNIPTRVNQINSMLKIATKARPIQSKGCEYSAIQKKRLSVALMTLVEGSELSNTQCDSPVCGLTSFHHRSPTRRRPAMFLR
jgi:hypothetical protein